MLSTCFIGISSFIGIVLVVLEWLLVYVTLNIGLYVVRPFPHLMTLELINVTGYGLFTGLYAKLRRFWYQRFCAISSSFLRVSYLTH